MLMQRWAKKLNSAGQSIVEISLVTPLVLIALYIPADFGIAMFTAHLTQNAVREAARIGVSAKTPFTGTSAGEIRTEALNRMPSRLSSKAATVTYYADGPANCAAFVEVIGQGTPTLLEHLAKLFRLADDHLGSETNGVRVGRRSGRRGDAAKAESNGAQTAVFVEKPDGLRTLGPANQPRLQTRETQSLHDRAVDADEP